MRWRGGWTSSDFAGTVRELLVQKLRQIISHIQNKLKIVSGLLGRHGQAVRGELFAGLNRRRNEKEGGAHFELLGPHVHHSLNHPDDSLLEVVLPFGVKKNFEKHLSGE